jgi:hypothetical protein
VAKCGPAPNIAHTSARQCNGDFEGRSCKYTCEYGYTTTVASANRTCAADSSWDNSLLACVRIECADAPVVSNAEVVCDTTESAHGDDCQYDCQNGYVPASGSVSPSTAICDAGVWSWQTTGGAALACTRRSCGALPAPPGAAASVASMSITTGTEMFYQDTSVVTCAVGYTLTGLAGGPTSFSRQCLANGTLDGAGVGCQPVMCGAAPTVQNVASQTLQDAVFGQSVVYTCATGHTVDGLVAGSGSLTLACLATGLYESVPTGACLPVKCEVPQSSDTDLVVTTGTEVTFATYVQVVCALGHVVGVPTSTMTAYALQCGASGSLNGTVGEECVARACGVPPSVANAELSDADNDDWTLVYEDSVDYECVVGHTLTGSAGGPTQLNVSCTSTGAFTTPSGCLPVTCGTVPALLGEGGAGTTTPAAGSTITYGQLVTYDCTTGFSMNGSAAGLDVARFDCGADGVLRDEVTKSSETPTCTRVACSSPPTIGEATFTFSEPGDGRTVPVFATTVEYVCSTDFSVDGQPASLRAVSVMCSASGALVGLNAFGADEACNRVECGAAPAVAHASVVSGPEALARAGDELDYECDEGYTQARSEFTATCQGTGAFSGVQTCPPVECGAAPVVASASRTDGGATDVELTFNETVSYACASGYSPTGDVATSRNFVVRCLSSGSLAADGYAGQLVPSLCQRVSCGATPDTPANSAGDRVPGSEMRFGDVVSYTCNTGHVLNGEAAGGPAAFQRECAANGQLTAGRTCVPVSCGTIAAVTNGVASASSIVFGETVTITCDTGFVVGTSGATVGTFTIGCTAGGQQTGLNVCVRRRCVTLPVVQHGSFSCSSDLYGDSCTPSCAAGYRPVDAGVTSVVCQADGSWSNITQVACEEIVECASSPCQNGATCVDQINRFTCTCVPGYVGTLCDVNFDECASSPCQNGAACNDGIASFECDCQPGFTGVRCQTNINECASAPCQNTATCVDGVDEYSCTCVVGFTGTLCETNIDECASIPCQNGATCVDGINRQSCVCPLGFTGALCETEVDPCESADPQLPVCASPATCLKTAPGLHVCLCGSGNFYGGRTTSCSTCRSEAALGDCRTMQACTNMTNTACTQCRVGSFLTSTNVCSRCPAIAHCRQGRLSCTSNSVNIRCRRCEPGYLLQSGPAADTCAALTVTDKQWSESLVMVLDATLEDAMDMEDALDEGVSGMLNDYLEDNEWPETKRRRRSSSTTTDDVYIVSMTDSGTGIEVHVFVDSGTELFPGVVLRDLLLQNWTSVLTHGNMSVVLLGVRSAPAPAASSSGGDSGGSPGLVIGIAVGAVLVAAVAIMAIVYSVRVRRREKLATKFLQEFLPPAESKEMFNDATAFSSRAETARASMHMGSSVRRASRLNDLGAESSGPYDSIYDDITPESGQDAYVELYMDDVIMNPAFQDHESQQYETSTRIERNLSMHL